MGGLLFVVVVIHSASLPARPFMATTIEEALGDYFLPLKSGCGANIARSCEAFVEPLPALDLKILTCGMLRTSLVVLVTVPHP